MPVPGQLTAATLWVAKRYATKALAPGRPPKAAIAAIALATAAIFATALLGPSAAVEPLPGYPPFGWHAHPSAAAVTALLLVAILAGAYGVLGCLDALRRGWALDTKRLLFASTLAALALGLLAPVGSSDPGSYAAYGRLAATGHDPYATPPSALTGPYANIAEPPWRTTTSVYGPIATGEQWLAAKMAGDGPDAPAHAVFILGIVNAIAFVATSLLLYRLAAGQAGRRRAAVMFSANPLLLFEGVAGQHIDVLLTFFVVAATALLGRRAWPAAAAAGLLGGVAVAIKASAALAGAGFAWAVAQERQRPARRLVALAIGAAAVLVPAYVLAGSHAFDQLRHASGFVSFADPWRIITHPLESLLGHDTARAFIRTAAWIAFAVLALLLNRGLPGRRLPGRAALVFVLAWLLTAPYVLPWYAVLAFALIALLPPSGFDRVLVFWISVLAIAYLPGRESQPLPSWLHHTIDVWKSGFAPALLLCTVIVAAALSIRRRS